MSTNLLGTKKLKERAKMIKNNEAFAEKVASVKRSEIE